MQEKSSDPVVASISSSGGWGACDWNAGMAGGRAGWDGSMDGWSAGLVGSMGGGGAGWV